jgi:hypothetical protein
MPQSDLGTSVSSTNEQWHLQRVWAGKRNAVHGSVFEVQAQVRVHEDAGTNQQVGREGMTKTYYVVEFKTTYDDDKNWYRMSGKHTLSNATRIFKQEMDKEEWIQTKFRVLKITESQDVVLSGSGPKGKKR